MADQSDMKIEMYLFRKGRWKMAMELLNPPTQIYLMFEINLQCGDPIRKSMIMQQDIILD